MNVIEQYWAINTAAKGKLMAAFASQDKKELTRIARAALDPDAPEDWCVWEIRRFVEKCTELKRKYRGLYLGITQGLAQPPLDPEPEMLLGLLLNGPSKKGKADGVLASMMGKTRRKLGLS